MKKQLITTFTILLFSASAMSQKQNQQQLQQPQQPSYSVIGTVQDWNQVLDVIDKSEAPNTTVKVIKQWITKQVTDEIAAEQAKEKSIDTTRKGDTFKRLPVKTKK